MSEIKKRIIERTEIRSIDLITYGHGDSYCEELFVRVKNAEYLKPLGGLWASPVGCEYGWKKWGELNHFGDFSTSFLTHYKGRTLTIDSYRDLEAVIWKSGGKMNLFSARYPDYEAMFASGVDAIYLTEAGEEETRFTDPGLYGWDCECVFVMNPKCLSKIKKESS